MAIENTREVIKNLLVDTDSNVPSKRIRWICTYESQDKLIFKCTIKVTAWKKLYFTVTSRRMKHASDLTITFGPIVDHLDSGGTLTATKLISVITPRNQPLLYDLLDNLNRKYVEDDVAYISEGMNTFHSDDPDVNERQEKLKNIKLLSTILQHTEEGKLNWECTLSDDNLSTFLSFYKLTDLKQLTFSVRSTNGSKKRDDNVFRVLFKKKLKTGNVSHDTSVIKTLYLNEYPSLIALIKKLNRKYLDRDFNADPISTVGTKVVMLDDIDQYKEEVLTILKQQIRAVPIERDWQNEYGVIFDAYDAVKKAKTYEEINDWMFKASQSYARIPKRREVKPNPIGNPRWATSTAGQKFSRN